MSTSPPPENCYLRSPPHPPFIYGGDRAISDKSRIEHKARWGTVLGMVYISINYRLSPRVQHPDRAKDRAKAWNAAGAKAILHHAPTKDHAAIIKELGMPNDADTEVVEGFIETILEQ